MNKWKNKPNLYQKFVLVMITLGLFPMLILSTFIFRTMIESYKESLYMNYEQAAIHISSSVQNMLTVYNDASKQLYSYNYGGLNETSGLVSDYDNLRKVLTGEIYAPEERIEMREQEMTQFLKNIESVDGYIYAVHFLAQNNDTDGLSFHYSKRRTFFRDEQEFERMVRYTGVDQTSKNLMLIPTHETSYYYGLSNKVFTVARNYFDIRGQVGQEKYVGTLFIDVDVEKLKLIIKRLHLDDEQNVFIVNEEGDCFFSTDESLIGENINNTEILEEDSKDSLIIETDENEYGLKVILTAETKKAYRRIASMQATMHIFIAICCLALLLASTYFSRKLTKPIHNMMDQMGEVENGNFDIELPVESNDEIGVLSERFNRMSKELKNYINQSYVAQIKQTEAELAALKSQIYPHFLYNTLEIIRMTALENDDEQVSKMIEALSVQIHYLIGQVQDMVPLEKELDIVEKYVYLLNCRISEAVSLTINANGNAKMNVPRLVLQPIVENAYVHGVKTKKGRKSIMIEAVKKEENLELSVMDNGVGMDKETLEQLNALLAGDSPGIKNEYDWQSIGLKNVHDRIRYLYGEEYGIRVTSNVGVGTIVTVILPYEMNVVLESNSTP